MRRASCSRRRALGPPPRSGALVARSPARRRRRGAPSAPRARRGWTRTASRRSSARSPSTRRDHALWMATNTGLFRVPVTARAAACDRHARDARGSGDLRAARDPLHRPRPAARLRSSRARRRPAGGSGADPLRRRRARPGRSVSEFERRRLPRARALRRPARRRDCSGRRRCASARDDGATWSDPRPRRAPSSTSRSTRRTRIAGSRAPPTACSAPPTRAAPGGPSTRRPNSRFAWPSPGALYRLDPGRSAEGQPRRRRLVAGPRLDRWRAAGARRRGSGDALRAAARRPRQALRGRRAHLVGPRGTAAQR